MGINSVSTVTRNFTAKENVSFTNGHVSEKVLTIRNLKRIAVNATLMFPRRSALSARKSFVVDVSYNTNYIDVRNDFRTIIRVRSVLQSVLSVVRQQKECAYNVARRTVIRGGSEILVVLNGFIEKAKCELINVPYTLEVTFFAL